MKNTFISTIYIVSILTVNIFLGCSKEDKIIKDNNLDENIIEVPAEEKTLFCSSLLPQTLTTLDQNRAFYWTSGDVLWVDDPTNSGKYICSDSINITGAQASSNFIVNKVFPKNITSAQVYYTGKNSNSTTSGLKVTIAQEQNQSIPNDASHIATSGDCGTALAVRQDDGRFTFKLDHKAAYLMLNPYWDSSVDGSETKLRSITVKSDKPIAGTFDFTDSGLSATPDEGTESYSITVFCGEDGFPMGNDYGMAKNGTYIVIHPNAHQLTIEYNFYVIVYQQRYIEEEGYWETYPEYDPNGIMRRTISLRDYDVNSVTQIRHKLKPDAYYTNSFYMWDAKKPFWDGVPLNEIPYKYSDTNREGAPQDNTDERWYNEANVTTALYSAATMPTFAAFTQYIYNTDYYWDKTQVWTRDGRVGVGAVWLMQWDYIPLEPEAEGSTPYTCTKVHSDQRYSTSKMLYGKPDQENLGKYFYLPALGLYGNVGTMRLLSTACGFYSSTPYYNPSPYSSDSGAYYMVFNSISGLTMNTNLSYRNQGYIAGLRPDGTSWFK